MKTLLIFVALATLGACSAPAPVPSNSVVVPNASDPVINNASDSNPKYSDGTPK